MLGRLHNDLTWQDIIVLYVGFDALEALARVLYVAWVT